MPFPQNKNLNVWYTVFGGQSDHGVVQPVVFIPVLNAPLSSNRYYVIERGRNHKGTYVKSKEQGNKTKCAYCGCISEKKPENGWHQQFEICKKYGSFFGTKSSSADAYAPSFLNRHGGWGVETSGKHKFLLHEVNGLDTKLRARLPDFSFQLSVTSSAHVIVGEWYSPFIFIQESLDDQVNKSSYYEITLDQRWKKIFGCENTDIAGNSVTVDVAVEAETVTVAEKKVDINKRNTVDGFMWFKSISNEGGEVSVGLSSVIVERMKWEQCRVGWTGKTGAEKQVKVKRVEEFEGNGEWRNFGCYVLVERYLIKRTDGNLVLSYEFKHTNQIRTKWE